MKDTDPSAGVSVFLSLNWIIFLGTNWYFPKTENVLSSIHKAETLTLMTTPDWLLAAKSKNGPQETRLGTQRLVSNLPHAH